MKVKLKVKPGNYYLHREDISNIVVYEGWPFGQNSSISALSLLFSDDKYGESSMVLLDMKKLIDTVSKKYPRIAELLFICGF